MAAATVYSSRASNSAWPRNCVGNQQFLTIDTIPTTSLDDIGDIYVLVPVRNGQRILGFTIGNHGDADTGGTTLDADIVLVDANGTTTLFNAGTEWTAARTTPLEVLMGTDDGIQVLDATGADDGTPAAYIGLKVIAAATTPAAVEFPFVWKFFG